jgi:hypothetical protein
MAEHPGYWLTQTRLNATQTILSGLDLFTLPDIKDVRLDAADPLEQMVYVHFFAGGFSFWAAAVEWKTGIFTGYSRNRLLGPTETWSTCTHEVLRGIRIPFKVNGEIVRIPLERDTRFRPRMLRDALNLETIG